MTWFKVDDGFYDHPKVLGLDMAARGLWVSAGAYCARHLTDGVITGKQIRTIGGTQTQAEKLVTAGLWSADDAPPSLRRYVFNDWRDFQPSRDDVTRRRNDDAERKREARAQRAAKQAKRENVRPDVQADVRADGGQGVRKASVLPDPTRPDPTNKEKTSKKENTNVAPFPTRKPDGKRMSDWLPPGFFDQDPPPDVELPPDGPGDYIDAEVINAD